jgi:DNA replication and repair protein RecF
MLTAAQDGGYSPAGQADSAAVLLRAGRLGVTRLVLTDFRNYRSARLDLEPEPEPVVLTGPNGAGKTNLLEAVSFLSPGRGLRNARLTEIDRHGSETGWAVAATVSTRRGTMTIGTGRLDAAERRAVRIDGEAARGQAALGERLGIVWLTPQMDRLFVEGPAGRRRLLDRLVLGLDPAHAGRVAAYEQAMRERSRLLRDGPNDRSWLAALEEVMAQKGVAVAAARRDAVERLDRACSEAKGPFPQARLRLDGAVEGWLDQMPALAAEDRLKQELAATRSADVLSGGAGTGPHRSDLAVTHAGKGVAAENASTGEQKALLISIVLAHARLQREVRGEAPILLLDEVAAHLDALRRDALFEALLALDGQVWMTGTDAAVFAPLRAEARFLSVAEGVFTETEF